MNLQEVFLKFFVVCHKFKYEFNAHHYFLGHGKYEYKFSIEINFIFEIIKINSRKYGQWLDSHFGYFSFQHSAKAAASMLNLIRRMKKQSTCPAEVKNSKKAANFLK